MNHVVKLVLLVLLAGVGAAVAKLGQLDSSLGWLVSILTPVIAIVVAYFQDPLSSGKSDGGGSADAPLPPKSTQTNSLSRARLAWMLPLAAAFAICTTSCTKAPVVVNPNVPTDIGQAIACVSGELLQGVVDFNKIEQACLPGQSQLLVDILQMLESSQALAKDDMPTSINASLALNHARRLGFRTAMKPTDTCE